ncbi:hypothetical protein MKW94_011742 [Papaver nudicaule]|uniref:F-box domain-containing protein n=1 Tax=Papaver nudicaule TaxID=74823 RepID=A0AA41W1N9_PAPNU|nr:hypothetical protein [Papaver nudicaule]
MDYIMHNNHTAISTEEPASSEKVRNWLELPYDVLSLIFLKLGVIHILFRAQSVCSLWRNFSKEPLLFRSIDMRHMRKILDILDRNMYNMEKMAREAVDRSCGQFVEFSMAGITPELLAYIAENSGELRCLRIVSSNQVNSDALVNVAKKAVMLEELEISDCSFSGDKLDMLKTVGNACPQLKSFRLNWSPQIAYDDEAVAIAENKPELRHLQLFGNRLTNVGLRAILDGCRHLESLDLRQCLFVKLRMDLLKIFRDRHIKFKLSLVSLED